jgi:hypothetical protein
MATLLIEHPISDFATWQAAFDRFAPVRREAGVRAHHVYRPADDPRYVVLTLDFAGVPQAEAFLRFLTAQVWADPQNSPALRGAPRTAVLEDAP